MPKRVWLFSTPMVLKKTVHNDYRGQVKWQFSRNGDSPGDTAECKQTIGSTLWTLDALDVQ